MEHEAPSTERSPFSRIEAVRETDCDELVDLFLGEAKPVSRFGSADDSVIDSRLDLIVASHLDDADVAFEQFCESISSDSRDSLGCVRHAGAGWVAWVHGRRLMLGERRASISTAVADVARRCERVLVLLPRQDEVGRLIAGLEGLSDPPDSIIILSTIREPDVVASYRQAKSIAALAPRQLPSVRFAIISDDAEFADAALTRLRDTSDRFLGVSIPGRLHIQENNEPATAEPGTTPQDGPTASPDPVDDPAIADAVADFIEQAYEAPEPAESPRMETPAQATLDLLSRFPGLEPIRLSCPGAESVVFGVDASGVLNAVVGGIGTKTTSEPERCLALAEAFVARHAPLLAAVDARLSPGKPVLATHFVSDRYAALAPLIGGRIHLHLAVGVEVQGVTHWGITELAV